jgi:hypothetical protein
MSKLWRLVLPFSSSLFRVYRHFTLAKDHAAPEAVSEGHAPFYGAETSHFITSEQRLNR